jgi:hypothetical protein
MLSGVLAGSIAMLAHGGKFAVRAAVTPSPEPVSNTVLSVSEDLLAIGLTWFAVTHPYIAAAIAILLILLTILLIRMVVRAIKELFRGARREWEQLQSA